MEVIAKLKNHPGSPRKTRLMIDVIRGIAVDKALHLLKFSSKKSAKRIEKLVLSAMSNWQAKNEGVRVENVGLYIKKAYVDGGRVLKRWRPAPRGSAHRIRKRMHHITIVLDKMHEDASPELIEKKQEDKKAITKKTT